MTSTTSEGIYTRLLSLSIRREDVGNSPSSTTHTTTSTLQQVRVTLTYPTSSSNSNSNTRQLVLKLTSDSDPIFFYHLRLGELEYPTLKQNQGLLVDFTGFSGQLISLLDKCGDDKFQLVMRSGRDLTILDIVESNPFKYLAHLSLYVMPGSDSEVKIYLAQLTLELKRENEGMKTQLQHMYASLQTELGKNKEELEKKDLELNQTREQLRNESSATSEKYFRDISIEKEKFIKFQSELTTKFEVEKLELERRHRENTLTLEAKFTSVDNEKRQLEQSGFRINSKLKDYETRLKSNEEDMRILNQELQILRKNNNKLDADYHEKQKSVLSLTNILTATENEIKEKCSTIAKQQDLITTLGEKVKVLEEKSHNLWREVDQSRLKMREIAGELNKANDIIRKLQEDSRQCGKKLKVQAQILSSQEKQLTEKTEELDKLLETHKTMTCKTESLQTELTATQQNVDELTEKVTNQTKSLESKENMIEWLNKQLNEFQGLSNLSKFRQNLNESSNSKVVGGGDAPSWMNIYNSTGHNSNVLPSISRVNNNNTSNVLQLSHSGAMANTTSVQDVEETLQKSSTSSQIQRQPSWTKSSKVTLGTINRPTFPLWKK